MKKRMLSLILLTAVLLPSLAWAAKTSYIYTDRKFHFVKRVEIGKKDLEDRTLNHPHNFTDFQLREMLAGLKFSREVLLKKEAEEKEVFSQANLDMMVPYLVQAFKDAKPDEEVVFSFITAKSKYLVRDDRLTIVRAWVEQETLHLNFRKLMAKVSNNWDKFSDVTQAMNRAQGIRVSLELGPGQQYGKTTDEILLTAPDASAVAAVVAEPAPTAKEAAAQPMAQPMVQPMAQPASVETRLKQIKDLEKKGLISKEEYEQKKKEILEKL